MISKTETKIITYENKKVGVRRIDSNKQQVNKCISCVDNIIRSETKTQLNRVNKLFGGGCLIGIRRPWPAIDVNQTPVGNHHSYNFVVALTTMKNLIMKDIVIVVIITNNIMVILI